jgi:hypothetical protein
MARQQCEKKEEPHTLKNAVPFSSNLQNQLASATNGPASSLRKKRRPGKVGIQLDVIQRVGP